MYLSNMQIFSAADNIRSKYKRIQETLRTTSFVCFGNATYAWYSISTSCTHSIHNKKRDKVTLLKKIEIKEQYPDDNYTEEEVYEAW